MEIDRMVFARIAYEAHNKALAPVLEALDRPPLPAWEGLPPRIKEAWAAVIEATIEAYSGAVTA
jgi:hypothetical protein